MTNYREPEMIKESLHDRYRNDRHRVVSNILYTSNSVAARLQKILNGSGLTLQQYNILRILSRQHPKPACNCTIREQMLDTRSDITRIVDRLVKEGLAVRKTCHNDRRKVSITITEKGFSLLEQIRRLHDEMDDITGLLTEQELLELNRLLDKVRIGETS